MRGCVTQRRVENPSRKIRAGIFYPFGVQLIRVSVLGGAILAQRSFEPTRFIRDDVADVLIDEFAFCQGPIS